MNKNKKKIIIPIIAVIAIIAILIVVKVNSNSKKQLLSELYNKLSQSELYQFTKEKDSKNKTIIAKKAQDTAIDKYSSDGHTTTIISNGTTSYVLHDREEYYTYNQTNVEQSIVTDWMKSAIDKGFTTGEEKVRGKKYKFEEYTGIAMFAESTEVDINEENAKTRFYFDNNNNLSYIKTIYDNNKEELLKIDISYEVDNSLFEIPSNYAEN